MLIDVLTLFPRMVSLPLAESILGKAQEKGLLRVRALDIREHAEGKHRNCDDVPYGGGAGMVMKPEPLVAAIERSRADLLAEGRSAKVILMSPQGPRFDERCAERLASLPALIFVCGRYEGVDERVLPFVDESLSLGDFVLTGGEFAALACIDAIARLLPGVLGNQESAQTESFARADTGMLLEAPHYTRPPEFRGAKVPEILMSGDHAKIAKWRRQQALLRTRERRADLFEKLVLTPGDKKLLE
jgi:tRNA (guanine37-N1)-methyltransferase